MSDKKEELLGFFFAEVDEQLENLESGILELEKDHGNKEIIKDIFRFAHSIKGSSASMGFQKLKDLTHEMEFVLDLIRKDELEASHEVVDVLFECLDSLRQIKEDYQNENEPNEIKEMVEKVRKLAKESSNDKISDTNGNKKEIKMPEEVITALKDGKDIFGLEVIFAAGSKTRMIRSHIIKKEVEKLGAIVFMDTSLIEVEEERKLLFYVVKEQDKADEVEERIRKIIDIEEVSLSKLEKPIEKTEKVNPAKKKTKKATNQTIRVDIHKIEDLMNLVGEILINQTMVTQINQMLKNEFESNEQVSEQERVLKDTSRLISEFQENVMKIRMLPIDQLFTRVPRIVRDLSGQLGKEITLVTEGGETELDRTVIEELNDPLVHIIRNSLDHGIESAEIRKERGKPENGTITISAIQKENQVVLTIEDDGAGIDPDKIKESAIKKGVITLQQAEKMTDNEIVQLVFAAGFSTAAVVSDVSGRGVGMDVVRNHIEKLNGMIEIETEKGIGTKMIIKLPLTLAILKAFLIEINKRCFAIPMNSVVEVFRIKKEEVQSINGQKMVKIRDMSIPLFLGNDMFGFEDAEEGNGDLIVMLIGIAEKRIGLIVDKLVENQEIVIKSLGSYVGKIPAISGATILGDGKVALILDAGSIIKIFSERKDVQDI